MTDKSVANVDLGHLQKRRGISTIYKLKQKTSKLLLHLNKSQTEAEFVMSLKKILIHPFKKPCIIETGTKMCIKTARQPFWKAHTILFSL